MSNLVDELAQRARALSAEDRARLAEDLLSTLQDKPDPEVEAAWDAEIRRRIDDIDTGRVATIPADEVFAEVRRMLK